MTIREALVARDPLKKLATGHFTNFKVARDIATLIKAINNEFEFFESESKKLIETYAEFDENNSPKILPDGSIQLKSKEAKESFEAEYNNLLDLDISDKVNVLAIAISDFKDADLLTPLEISALSCIIDWID